MAEYTPTTDEVETAFHEFASLLEMDEPGSYPDAPEFADWREAMAGFRRWKAKNDRQVAEKAWDEGYRAFEHGYEAWNDNPWEHAGQNPYRVALGVPAVPGEEAEHG